MMNFYDSAKKCAITRPQKSWETRKFANNFQRIRALKT